MRNLSLLFILISLNLLAQKPVEVDLTKKYAAESLVKQYCDAIIGVTKDKAESVALLREMIIERMDNESWDDIKTGVPISFNRYFTILSEEKINIQFTRIPTRKDFLYYAGETKMNGEKVRIPYIVAPLTKTINGKQVTGYLAIRPGNIKVVDYRKKLPEWAVVYDNDGNIYKNKASQQVTDKSIEYYLSLAKQGNVYAQNHLGDLYYDKKDYQKAFYWYKKAANQCHASGQYNLGIMYEYGKGINQDYQKAFYLYKKAANQGHARAQRGLGLMYEYGDGVKQDYKKAVYWHKKAANQGDAWGQFDLGDMYYKGKGVNQDYQKAKYWYEKAANKGISLAQAYLGKMYHYGYGVKQDYQKAKYWYEKAANKEEPMSLINLGEMYHYGYGVKQDYLKAFYLYEKAANQGIYNAQFRIGHMYEYGKGVNKNSQKAIYWYQKACGNGHGLKKACEKLKN